LLTAILYLFGVQLLLSQPLPIVQEKNTREGFDVAKSYYDLKQFTDALPAFQKMLSEDPENSNLNFIVGDCMLNVEGYEKDAFPYLEKATKNIIVDYNNLPGQRRAPVFAFEKLGDIYYNDYRFDDALTNYRIFKTYLDPKKDKEIFDGVNKKIGMCIIAKRLVENPLKLTLTEIPFVNVVSFADFSGRLTEDGNIIYFSRKRIGANGASGSNDIYYMRKIEGKWSRPVRMPFINSDADDNFCWVSRDGNQILLASNRDGKFQLYLTERKGKSQWTLPEALNNNINGKGESSFGYISADGKILYFVSDRKGGLGGKDIYRAIRPFGGDWGPAENLGAKVNTPNDEDTPFITDDGKTLYFSSKGWEGMGGFDVFYVTQTATFNWSDPVNAGYPVNTVGDDLCFNRSQQGKPDYFLSRSKAGKNEFAISVLNESETVANLTEVKAKEATKEKPRLKLVPKTLKY
ncbi:MAG: hypothetical protein NTU44_11005, partial [Bacteroidetes bacterium]|nr:hypothetical protein [Bacteroidota bacterium]